MSIPANLPISAGVGFKPEHLGEILAAPQPIGFFEIHAENYMGAGGPPHAQLAALRERYALSVHGVGLSIGSTRPLDGVYLNDLLPLPYTEQTLARVAEHVDEVQTALGRQMLLENPSTYIRFAESTIREVDFLVEISRRTGCGLLLDVNNVLVSATNHGTQSLAYLEEFPLERVKEIHLGGHNVETDDDGAPLLIDSHRSPVADQVWALYAEVISRTAGVPTLIEWDEDVPDWPMLCAQAVAAQGILSRVSRASAA